MVRRLPGADFRGHVKFCTITLLLLTVLLLWQGCSDDPVTPRKSVIGVWELTSIKLGGEVVNYGLAEKISFNADNTGYSEIYVNEEIAIPRRDIAWEINGDSISITREGVETMMHWYSCTNDRLTLKYRFDKYDDISELIYARMEEE